MKERREIIRYLMSDLLVSRILVNLIGLEHEQEKSLIKERQSLKQARSVKFMLGSYRWLHFMRIFICIWKQCHMLEPLWNVSVLRIDPWSIRLISHSISTCHWPNQTQQLSMQTFLTLTASYRSCYSRSLFQCSKLLTNTCISKGLFGHMPLF